MDVLLPYVSTTTVVLIAILYCFLRRRARAAKGLKAPKAAGGWPILGHLQLFSGPKPPHITLGALAEKYGPVYCIRLGVHPTLVVSSSEVARELFTAKDTVVASRPKFVSTKLLGYNYVLFAFAPYGPYWRELRKIVMVELLSNHRLQLLKHVFILDVETSLRELYRVWEEKKNGGSEQVLVEMRQWFGDMSLNTILKLVAGQKYSEKSALNDRMKKAMRQLFEYLGMFVLRDAAPFLGWLDVGGHEKSMKKTAEELDSFLGQWLQEHKRKRDLGEVEGEQDFMDVMLSVLDDVNVATSGYDVDTIIKSTCLAMIGGGSDTTLVALTWALALLLNNPHVLIKAQEELDICVGKERLVSDSDINKLVYLQAIVKETLRLYPSVPLSAPHLFMEDCTLSDYKIPNGTWLIVNLWKIQTDPKVWPDPFEFRPERFLTTHKDVEVRGQNFELIPFGSGRRACPGTSFALQLVHLALATFLHAFQFSTPSNEPVDMSGSPGLTNLKATPLEVLVAPRLPPKVYIAAL
ncbi:cytochrome P450 CYP82D47-like [Tripterygium wilfordii]|uniref:cytochrome P450 CYP82D47-like n=1 Tax=Tripterygium wilfordii TaxID=458696 RepID=UPI0018F85BFD|nr:cytochrome P450 CYP82D47-like [Tripterygium wilfordii]